MDTLPDPLVWMVMEGLPFFDIFWARLVCKRFDEIFMNSFNAISLQENVVTKLIKRRDLPITYDSVFKNLLRVYGKNLKSLRLSTVEMVLPEQNFKLICLHGQSLTQLEIPIIFDNEWLTVLGAELRNLLHLKLMGEFPMEYLPKFPNLQRLFSTLKGPFPGQKEKPSGERGFGSSTSSIDGSSGDVSHANVSTRQELIRCRLRHLHVLSEFEPDTELLEELFRTGDFAVPAAKELVFSLSGLDAAKVSTCLAFIRNFPGVECLRFKSTTIDSWSFLKNVPILLQKLEFSFCNLHFQFRDYENLARFRELREIFITGPSLSDFGFLNSYPNLTSIRVMSCKNFNVTAFSNIPSAAKLERIFLRGVPAVSNELVNLLSERDYQLKELVLHRFHDYFGDAGVDGDDVKHVLEVDPIYRLVDGSAMWLESLDLSGHSAIGDEIFEHITGKLDYSLTNLALENTAISDVGVKQFLDTRREKFTNQELTLPLLWFFISWKSKCVRCVELGEEGNVEVTIDCGEEDDENDEFFPDDDDEDDDSPDYSDPEFFEGADLSDVDD